IAVVGPLVEREGDRCFNAALAFDASGARLARYRKRHPWYPEGWAAPLGARFEAFELAGLRCAIAICFDIHFVKDEAADVLSAIDVLAFPSAWVDEAPGEDARGPILEDLARRFGVAVVNANWSTASRPRVLGQGGSRIVAPDGRELARADDGAAIANLLRR
ncbi:MAG TPA: carbon-nitrogen hydrolase family protein, partial [Minicystis sp.]|nr:carbon-nitrogen hydrolase family protein [Minicystis sp.]